MGRILLVLPIVGVARKGGKHGPGGVHFDPQTFNGLNLWKKHFPYVQYAFLITSKQDDAATCTFQFGETLAQRPLPEVWNPISFARNLPAAVRMLSDEIDQVDYLHFAIGGLWGDWPSVAAMIAAKKGRQFSIWTDHVESSVHRSRSDKKRGLSKAYTNATASLMSAYERRIVRRANLGLFHGADCYQEYAPISPNPHLVHDVHIKADQHISLTELNQRLSSRHGPLRLVYAGRAAPEKGIIDWVRAVSMAAKTSDIVATWYGDGPDMQEAKRVAAELNAPVSFPGPLPHSSVLDELKKFDAFLFCHKTLESPRCLIEALACGLPLVGYDSAYPADLTARDGGSVLVPKNSIERLAKAIVELTDERLQNLSFAARDSVSELTDEAVFAHRAELIKTHLKARA